MLYPDLGRLSLAHACPTGMALPRGTHNHEAGGSNDPPPPPPPVAGPVQRYALGQRDVVAAILSNLGGGNYEDACRVAARWCSLNSEHQAACEAHQPWTDLTQAVFPHSRAPNPRDHEPEHPRDWFFYLCNRHARVAALQNLINKMEITKKYLSAQHMRDAYSDSLRHKERLRAAQRSRASNELFTPGHSGHVRRSQIEELQKKLEKAKRDVQRYEAEGAITWVTSYDDFAAWVGELATLQAYMRGLYSEPY